MSTYRNNLQKGDRVMHAPTKRVGTVAVSPRESSRNTSILWQGSSQAKYVDVLELRLIVNNQPEEVPPCDGAPPGRETAASLAASSSGGGYANGSIESLKRDRDLLDQQMNEMNEKFKKLREYRERLDRAIQVLDTPAA
jgi:hypothetical protein